MSPSKGEVARSAEPGKLRSANVAISAIYISAIYKCDLVGRWAGAEPVYSAAPDRGLNNREQEIEPNYSELANRFNVSKWAAE